MYSLVICHLRAEGSSIPTQEAVRYLIILNSILANGLLMMSPMLAVRWEILSLPILVSERLYFRI